MWACTWPQGKPASPAERTHAVFRKWFEVRFYPLIQHLVGEELTATEMDEEFIGTQNKALAGDRRSQPDHWL